MDGDDDNAPQRHDEPERDAAIAAAGRLLGIGLWSFDLATGAFVWSRHAHRTFGTDAESMPQNLDAYAAIVHPDDRARMVADFEAFRTSNADSFAFEHRIVRPDGKTVHVRGAAEVTVKHGRRLLAGVIQDVSAEHEAQRNIDPATQMLRVAGRVGRFGGWRVGLSRRVVEWTAETADIHEAPGTREVTVEQGINYCAEEYRDRMAKLFTACAERGDPFDDILQIVSDKGRRIWVRAIGEAVRDAAGRIVAVQGAFQDISPLMSARERSYGLAERLRQVLETMGDAFIALDSDWRVTFMNTQAESLLRCVRDEIFGTTLAKALPGGFGAVLQDNVQTVMDSGRPETFDAQADDPVRWFRVSAHPHEEGVALYFRDITFERKREEQLRLLEAAVAQQKDVLIITEADSIDWPEGPRIVYVNDAFERVTGFSPADAIGKTPRIQQGPETDPAQSARIRAALERGEPVRAELLNYRKDGSAYWKEIEISPVRDAAGTITHWVSVHRDITERREAEAAVRESEERFRLVSMATHDAIWDYNIVAGTLWRNDRFRDVFGHDCEVATPENWKRFIHEDDYERVVTSLNRAIEGDAVDWAEEYRFYHSDGRVAIVVDRGIISRDADGRAVRMLGSLRDVTENRIAEDRARKTERMEALGQLTGGIAHDFNNLLTVILGSTQMLAMRSQTKQLRDLAELAASAARRGADLTERLLAFSRRQPLMPESIDVGTALSGMEGLLRRTLPETITLTFSLKPDLPSVEIDPAQFETTILNLVINSRDAMPNGGRILIETDVAPNPPADNGVAVGSDATTAAGPMTVVSVTDTGCGMTREVLQHVFEPFFTTKSDGKGTGLGLSTVYGFVRQSGGQVRVYSEPGRGTTVRLYLPCGEHLAASAVEEVALDDLTGEGHILLAEDDALVRSHVTLMLTDLGYTVTAAEDGRSALKALETLENVDLLLSDVVMSGGMTGPELAVAVQERRPGIPVLFMSGYTENALLVDGRVPSDVHLLSKPFDREKLARMISQMLES